MSFFSQVREFSNDTQLVLAGSGCESTAHTIAMTNAMAEAGADAAVVITPSYFKAKMNSAALKAHFTAVADNSAIPVILYSVPANTTLDMDPGAVADLAGHPNIIGIKDSGGDIAKIGKMVHDTKGQVRQFPAGGLQRGCRGRDLCPGQRPARGGVPAGEAVQGGQAGGGQGPAAQAHCAQWGSDKGLWCARVKDCHGMVRSLWRTH